ncbi:kinase-like domain-containing protein [Rhizophagus irregularis DAOM 181602=DAOM 197198]|nr:kinase-like domain-containing protein [Rhizophagus irregularis DAOM 181602=DAOM 197198]
MDEKPKDLWKEYSPAYQFHVTISTIDSTINSENIDERVVYIEDLEKRKQAYGICGECKEPGTGQYWCRPCNAKRFKDNFKNWTSGNKDIDELIQHSQLNAVHFEKCFEWIPFEKFQNVTYIAKGGFDFLNEIKSHLQINLHDIVQCFGITQDPNNKDELYYQTQESDEIRRKKFKNSKSNDDRSENIQTHSQAIYTSRLLNFKNFPKPVNSSDLSSFQFSSDATQSTSANPISECLDVQLSELELNEICQDSENNIE